MKRIILQLMILSFVGSELCARSIQDIPVRRLPKVGFTKRLVLSGMDISDLEGLANVRGIENARILNLSNNRLRAISKGVLAPAKKLRGLNLSNNELTAEGLQGLAGLKNLQVLVLDSNQVDDIPQEVLDRLPRLKVVIIRNNPISGTTIGELRRQGLMVYTFPKILTARNIKGALAVTGIIAGVALATLGAVEGYKAGKEYSEHQALAKQLRESAGQDKEKEGLLRTEIEAIKQQPRTDARVRQPLEWQADFLEQLATKKRDWADLAEAGNIEGLKQQLAKMAGDIKNEIEKQEQQLLDARSRLITPAAVGNNIEGYINSLQEQLKQIEQLPVYEQAVEEEEEQHKERVGELLERSRKTRREMEKKYKIPGPN